MYNLAATHDGKLIGARTSASSRCRCSTRRAAGSWREFPRRAWCRAGWCVGRTTVSRSCPSKARLGAGHGRRDRPAFARAKVASVDVGQQAGGIDFGNRSQIVGTAIIVAPVARRTPAQTAFARTASNLAAELRREFLASRYRGCARVRRAPCGNGCPVLLTTSSRRARGRVAPHLSPRARQTASDFGRPPCGSPHWSGCREGGIHAPENFSAGSLRPVAAVDIIRDAYSLPLRARDRRRREPR